MVKKVVLISGKAGSGKSTIAHGVYFAWQFKNMNNDKTSMLLHFGDMVKIASKEWFGWKGFKNVTGRKILQTTGQTMREIDPDIWIKFVHGVCNISDPEVLFIGDCRYKNEIEYFQKLIGKENCLVVRLKSNRPSLLTDAQKNHQSETDLDDYPFELVYDNNNEEQKQKIIEDILSRLE